LNFAFCIPTLAADTATTAAPSRLGWYAILNNGFNIRHLRRETLGTTTRLWITDSGYADVPTAQIVGFEQEEIAPAPPATPQLEPAKLIPRSVLVGQPVEQLVREAGGKHQIDPEFIASVIRAESAFNAHAVSPKGARGLMQLMPQTASRLGVADSFDPGANVDGGTRYLRALLDQYHGDAARALAAYNAGPRRVVQYGGVPPYRETQAYVRRVINDYNRRKIAADPKLAKRPAKQLASRSH